jgi:hypothetical protein
MKTSTVRPLKHCLWRVPTRFIDFPAVHVQRKCLITPAPKRLILAARASHRETSHHKHSIFKHQTLTFEAVTLCCKLALVSCLLLCFVGHTWLVYACEKKFLCIFCQLTGVRHQSRGRQRSSSESSAKMNGKFSTFREWIRWGKWP